MLTDAKIKNLKPGEKIYSIADSNCLAIYILPNGRKNWRYRYRYNKTPSMVTLGDYPNVGLKEARDEMNEYRDVLSKGINPSAYKKTLKLNLQGDKTFKSLFDRWFARHKGDWAERTAKKNIAAFEKYIFPYIGDRVVSTIKPLDMLEVFRRMDDKGIHQVLIKTRGWTSRVFRECVVLGLIQFDPTRDLPSDAFKKKKSEHYATLTHPDDVASLLNLLENYREVGTYQVAEALNLAPHLFLRPSELVETEWREVDFTNKLIRVSAKRMKMSKEHLVPMSKQVLLKLKEIHSFGLSDEYVFPSPTKNESSINAETLRAALRRIGVTKEQLTTHGFRSLASTRLNELGFREAVIERQLSHIDSNQVRRAYNHAEYLDERRDMMQYWSDYLDSLKDNWSN